MLWGAALTALRSPVAKYAAALLVAWIAISWFLGVLEDRVELRIQKQSLEDQVQIERDLREAEDEAERAAAESLVDAQAEIARLEALLREVENAPTSDDGEIAPVLRRALDGLNGV